MIKIITVGQDSYIGEVIENKDYISIVKAHRIQESKMNDILYSWFRESNVDALETITIKGLISYTIRELNQIEIEMYKTFETRFGRCQDICMGMLINSIYDNLYK